jgi:hypothetical protein
VAAAGRRLRLLYGSVCGFAALLMLGVLVGVGSYEPGDLIGLAPLVLVLAGGLALLMRFTYRRNTAKVRLRATEQLPRMPPLGAPVVVDLAGLGVGADLHPWNDLAVSAIDITATSFNDVPLTLIERLELDAGGARPIVLDAVLISNGRAAVDEIWRRLREAGIR